MAGQIAQNARNWAVIIVVRRCMGNRPPCCLPEPCRPFFFGRAGSLDDPTDLPREITRVWRSPPDHPSGRKRRGQPQRGGECQYRGQPCQFFRRTRTRKRLLRENLTLPCLEPRQTIRGEFSRQEEIIGNGTSFASPQKNVRSWEVPPLLTPW